MDELYVSCREIGYLDCDFCASGRTAQEVKQSWNAHAAHSHHLEMTIMNLEERLEIATRINQILCQQSELPGARLVDAYWR